MNNSQPNNLNAGFKLNNILFVAIAAGQIFIFIIFLFLVESRSDELNKELDSIFLFVVPFFGMIMMFLSRLVYNQNLMKVSPNDSLNDKMARYRIFKIICWAMLEGAGLFGLVAFFLTANYLYAIVFIFVFGFFLFNRASKEGFVIDMQISGPEKEGIFRN